jgi:hypothetical protein
MINLVTSAEIQKVRQKMSQPIRAIPGTGGLQPTWSWCAACQRAYITGTYRLVRLADPRSGLPERVLKLCPYVTCGGSATNDRWRWSSIRERHPEFPEFPQMYVRYPEK